MKKRNLKKIKERFNLKTAMIFGGVLALIVLVGGVTTIVALNNKKESNNQNSEIAQVIPKKCPYTLEEIYEKIETNWIFDKNTTRDEKIEFAYVLLHFYDYFNKETEFMVWDLLESGEPKTFKMISYDEYMEKAPEALERAEGSISRGASEFFYYADFRLFMLSYSRFDQE